MTDLNTFLEAQVAQIEAQITAYQSAAISLASNQIQSFSYGTGQTQETVTKFNVAQLHAVIESLYNQLVILSNRLNGGGSVIARPVW